MRVTVGRLRAAVAAAAVVLLLTGCAADRPPSEFQVELMEALSPWSEHIQAIEEESNHKAMVVTDLTSSDPLDYGMALGMCEQIRVTAIEGLLIVGIESVGGLELTYCATADE